MNNKSVKLLITVLVPVIIWFVPPPEGLTLIAWRLFGIYLAAILGLVLKPLPAPLVLLTAIAGSSVFLNNPKAVLVGYASSTLWLVFAAFTLSVAFVKTGLGRRIAYTMIGKFGKTTLRLGYVTAFLDLIIAPVTPSNTARAGGIVFPIIHAVAKALGSEPGESAKKGGSYLMSNIYFVTKVTSFMFATAMAPNLLAADFMKKILDVNLSWAVWATAMIVPGLTILLTVPLIGYYMDRPTVTHIDNKAIAREGLDALGPMKKSEKILIGIFVLALMGWALPSVIHSLTGFKIPLSASSVALGAMALCFLGKIIEWDDMLKSKGAWNTYIWFGGIIGLSGALTKLHFFDWLAKVLENNVNFGSSAFTALIVIGILSILVRYLFASGTAYIVAMLPVFLTVGKVVGVNPMALALVLAATNAYGGCLTHYGGAAAPIVFGAGYNDVRKWWIVGAVVAVVSFILTMTVGYTWWHIIGFVH